MFYENVLLFDQMWKTNFSISHRFDIFPILFISLWHIHVKILTIKQKYYENYFKIRLFCSRINVLTEFDIYIIKNSSNKKIIKWGS